MQLAVRDAVAINRSFGRAGKPRTILSGALRRLAEICASDPLTARLAASGIFAAAILLAAYLAVRLLLDL